MGWNSWNCFAGAVTAEEGQGRRRRHGEERPRRPRLDYINIDDFWEVHRDSKDPTLQGPQRDAEGRVAANPRFPDMKGLVDYIHAQGPEGRHLFLARPPDLRRLRRQLPARGAGRRASTPSGASTTSSTTGAPTETIAQGQRTSTTLQEAVPGDARRAAQTAARHRLQPLPVRHGRRLGVGRRRSAATAGAPPATSPTPGAAWPASASARPGTSRSPAPATGTTPTCWSSGRSAGARTCIPPTSRPNEQYTHISLWCAAGVARCSSAAT